MLKTNRRVISNGAVGDSVILEALNKATGIITEKRSTETIVQSKEDCNIRIAIPNSTFVENYTLNWLNTMRQSLLLGKTVETVANKDFHVVCTKDNVMLKYVRFSRFIVKSVNVEDRCIKVFCKNLQREYELPVNLFIH